MVIVTSNLKCILKTVDIFPQTFEFNVNGKGQKKTVQGGFVSIITVSLILIITFTSFYSFLFNRKASIVMQTQYSSGGDLPSSFNSSQIQFMLSLWSNDKPLNLSVNNSNIILNDLKKNGTSSLNIGNFQVA